MQQLEAAEKQARENYTSRNSASNTASKKNLRPASSSGKGQPANPVSGRVILAKPPPKIEDYLISLEPEKKEIVERIFAYYCSFGDPMNSQGLKSSKFIKFLRESGLLKQGALHNHQLKAGITSRKNSCDPKSKGQFK